MKVGPERDLQRRRRQPRLPQLGVLSALVAMALMFRKSLVSAVMVMGPRMLSLAVCTTVSAEMIGLEVTLLQMTLGQVFVNQPTWKVGLRQG